MGNEHLLQEITNLLRSASPDQLRLIYLFLIHLLNK